MESDLKPILKALLISTGDPLTAVDIQKLFTRYSEEREHEDLVSGEDRAEDPGEEESSDPAPAWPKLVTVTRIREAMESLQRELESGDEVYRIHEGPRGYQLVCAPEYADWIRLLRNEPKPIRLTPAGMETLTIIAYRQPVTRSEMEMIRGVSVDSALNKLLELELVQVLGRADLPGRPIQYGTTEAFLEFAGIKSTEELPASDIVASNNLDAWIREINNRETISDQDVGLPNDGEFENVSSRDDSGDESKRQNDLKAPEDSMN